MAATNLIIQLVFKTFWNSLEEIWEAMFFKVYYVFKKYTRSVQTNKMCTWPIFYDMHVHLIVCAWVVLYTQVNM
jgi:hypothetical protein